MSPVAIALDLLLAGLLVLALFIGARLNRRLKALRESHSAFSQAVAELNQAAARAQAGLASLRAASEEVHDSLLTRIETARALIAKLERATIEAEKSTVASAVPPAPAAPLRDLASFSSSKPVRRPREEEAAAPPAKSSLLARSAPAATPPAPAKRSRPSTDEELFVKGGWDADTDFQPLRLKREDGR